MKNIKNHTGEKYGRLLVLEFIKREKRNSYWKCICDCGKEIIIPITYLTVGDTKSCGCYRKEVCKNKVITKHNLTKTRIYHIWSAMKQRCYNKNLKEYKHYGFRGIKVCDEWLTDFMNFYIWAYANGYQSNLSIDRINNDGNYEPNNCRWATIKEQNNNMSTNHFVLYKNEKLTLSQLAEKYNIKYDIVKNRMRLGWYIERIVTQPIRNRKIK